MRLSRTFLYSLLPVTVLLAAPFNSTWALAVREESVIVESTAPEIYQSLTSDDLDAKGVEQVNTENAYQASTDSQQVIQQEPEDAVAYNDRGLANMRKK